MEGEFVATFWLGFKTFGPVKGVFPAESGDAAARRRAIFDFLPRSLRPRLPRGLRNLVSIGRNWDQGPPDDHTTPTYFGKDFTQVFD